MCRRGGGGLLPTENSSHRETASQAASPSALSNTNQLPSEN